MKSDEMTEKKGLSTFFGTELWERYGFYIVQSLLVIFMAEQYDWHDDRIYLLMGSFTAITYLAPIVGGFIADRLIGQKLSIIAGIVVLFFSYLFLTTIHSVTSLESILAAIAVGTGLLKPNVSSLLGNIYPIDSPKRESGFTIFYMGITTGIILGTTLPSILLRNFGWSIAFASAACGMILSGFIFIRGIKKYHIKNFHPHTITVKKVFLAICICATLWFMGFNILIYPQIANIAFGILVLICIGYIVLCIITESPEQAKKTFALGLLCIISTVFWAFYFQMFTSLTLFISRLVKPTLFGIMFTPPFYVSIQSAGMLIFGYFIAKKYTSSHINAISIGKKFLASIFLMTLAYGVIAFVSNEASDTVLISPLMIIPAYLIISIAELLLSPTGLSAITVLADHRKVSTMMGIFFVSLGMGAFLSGKLALIASIPQGETSQSILNIHYSHAFTILFAILSAASLFCMLIMFFIKRLFKKGIA